MLKGISRAISPELMSVLMKMGHGDEIVFADADFPADTYGKRVIRADGIELKTMLRGVLELMPLDTYVEKAAAIMVIEDNMQESAFMKEISQIIAEYHPMLYGWEYVERFAFYERSKKCFAIVITGEVDGNVILRKGVLNL